MCCSLRAVITCGIILAVFDILHGLSCITFYGYQFLVDNFLVCPHGLNTVDCYNQYNYLFDELFLMRTYIGMGEGAVTLIFDIIYIVALVKHLPCLSWMWIFKAFGVMGINVYYISYWMGQRDILKNLTFEFEIYRHFLITGIVLALSQLLFALIFCIIGAVFSYRVATERRRSRRSLHTRTPKYRNGNASAPPMDDYDDNQSYLNHALTDSTNKLPIPGSTSSIDKMSHADTLKQQPTPV